MVKLITKEILKNPTEYFTDDIMELKLDLNIAQKHFSYGTD